MWLPLQPPAGSGTTLVMTDRSRPARAWVRHAGLAVLLLLPTVLVYAPSLRASFVYDDYPYVVDNPLVTDPGISPWRIFAEPFPHRTASRDWYRPLPVLSYRLNAPGGGLAAPAFHVVNLALHLGVVVLVFIWSRYWLCRSSATVAALLFGVMPGHAEAVLWVSGRSELLATCCVLAGLVFLGRRQPEAGAARGSALALALFFGLGLLAKESAVVLAPLVVAVAVGTQPRGYRSRDGWRWAGRVLPAMVAVLAAYLLLRLVVVGRLLPTADELPGISVLQRLPLTGRVWWQAVTAFIYLPQPSVEYHWLQPLRWTWQSAAGWGVVTAAMGGWFLCRQPALRHGIAVSVCGLVLYSHLLASTELFAERFLYLPSAGSCLLLAAAHQALRRRLAGRPEDPRSMHRVRQGLVTALAVVCCCATGWRAFTYAQVWHDDISLWRYTTGVVPHSSLAWFNYGAALQHGGKPQQALAAYRRALGGANDDRRARLAMLRTLGQLGRHHLGVLLAMQSLQRYPDDPELLLLQGRHQLGSGDLGGARATLTLLRALAGTDSEATVAVRLLEQELEHHGRQR